VLDDAQQQLLLRLSPAPFDNDRGAWGSRGALLPIRKSAYLGAYPQHQLARIYLLAGQLEKALDELEPLLEIPCHLSPGWLRIDPTFAPLRGNPRFEKLAQGS
jgi:hypothetical protein